jgi:hypothetical protein
LASGVPSTLLHSKQIDASSRWEHAALEDTPYLPRAAAELPGNLTDR